MTVSLTKVRNALTLLQFIDYVKHASLMGVVLSWTSCFNVCVVSLYMQHNYILTSILVCLSMYLYINNIMIVNLVTLETWQMFSVTTKIVLASPFQIPHIL